MSSKILGKNESQYVPSRFHLRRVSGAIVTIKSKLFLTIQHNNPKLSERPYNNGIFSCFYRCIKDERRNSFFMERKSNICTEMFPNISY